MRIGIVSDTHNNLKNIRRIVSLFNAAGVERVIHAGDITRPASLLPFADLNCPLYGVFGNNDIGEKPGLLEVTAQQGFHFVDPPLLLGWHERQICVVHDPLEFEGHLENHHDIALHGHTHRQRIEQTNQRLYFNPGECAGHMEGLNSIGILNLEAGTPEIITF